MLYFLENTKHESLCQYDNGDDDDGMVFFCNFIQTNRYIIKNETQKEVCVEEVEFFQKSKDMKHDQNILLYCIWKTK